MSCNRGTEYKRNLTGEQDMSLQFIFTKNSFLLDQISDQTDGVLSEKEEKLRESFLRDRYKALFQLGCEAAGESESLSLAYLRLVSERFLETLISMPELELVRELAEVTLSEDAVEELLLAVPFSIGTEYIDQNWLEGIYAELNAVFRKEMTGYGGTVQMFLTEKGQQLRVPERIFFHLVESKDEDFPFAFMATYATAGEDGRVRHMPLSYALTEFKTERDRLVTLLSCLNRVSEVSELIGGFVESGELFHPLKFTVSEAYEFLKGVPAIERCGVLCRVPNWWRKKLRVVQPLIVFFLQRV